MSYQVIARKWRPQTFEEVTGQEVVTHTLRNALEFDRLHHAYLFSGARGVGKTTTARILAKALNCHKSEKPTLTPCRTDDPAACPSCMEIAESRSMDVLEIDAASHTGIDDVRGTILEGININPARDRYKVFIIDEVHQLSKPAFNALLKTLEEPPGNVVFVMATTELHKVPETITSRCQEFQFRTIAIQKIFDRLKLIADADKLSITDDALREIARSGMGSMRDAQSNFDQVISFSGNEIESMDVTKALGFAGADILAKTVSAIADSEPKVILEIVDDLISRGHDLRNFCRDLLGLFRDLMVNKVAGGSEHLFESAVFSQERMSEMAASFSESDLLRFFNSLAATEASLREAAQPRFVLEIGLVKLVEMRRVAPLEGIIERLAAIDGGANIAVAATAEKKTLVPEPAAIEPIVEVSFAAETNPEIVKTARVSMPAIELIEDEHAIDTVDEPPFDEIGDIAPEPPDDIVKLRIVEQPPRPVFDPASMPSLRLAPIDSAELEHFEDERLDGAYDELLEKDGDDLAPIHNAAMLVDLLTGRFDVRKPVVHASNGSSGAAAAPAVDVASIMPAGAQISVSAETPTLAEDPTDDELIAFAIAHPKLQPAIHIFKATVVEAKKL